MKRAGRAQKNCTLSSPLKDKCIILCVNGYVACDILSQKGFKENQLIRISIISIQQMIDMLAYERVDAVSGAHIFLRKEYLRRGYKDSDFKVTNQFDGPELFLSASTAIDPQLWAKLKRISHVNLPPKAN